jgi:hypothetical protein
MKTMTLKAGAASGIIWGSGVLDVPDEIIGSWERDGSA